MNQKEQKQRDEAYVNAFSSIHGENVIRDLTRNYLLRISYKAGASATDAAFREGQRDMVLRICRKSGIDIREVALEEMKNG